MLNRNFRIIIIFALAIFALFSLFYGIYSRGKYKLFLGSGRVPELQAWSAKASISWVASVILTILMIAKLVVEE